MHGGTSPMPWRLAPDLSSPGFRGQRSCITPCQHRVGQRAPLVRFRNERRDHVAFPGAIVCQTVGPESRVELDPCTLKSL